MKSFTTLPLSQAMLDNLEKLEYEIMTPIQEKSIPPIIGGSDILAQAKTGSGKTAAFGIGLLHMLNVKRFRIQALVLCPTRELAEQVTGELRRLARFQHNIKLIKITGGLPMRKQEHSLSHEAHIVVGTPGRILKLLDRGSLKLDEVKMIVLDEADRMLDMGFIDEIAEIFRFAPSERQTLCFSATFPDEIKSLSRSILYNPVEISVDTEHDREIISQHFFRVKGTEKCQAVTSLLAEFQPQNAIIFCNTKDSCRKVEKELISRGLHSLALHGDLEQKERTEVLIRFANGSSNILVATDVAARGLDISDLGAVINYDLPFETETYVHRIGRTGRAGKEGLALSLLSEKEDFRIHQINQLMKEDFTIEEKTWNAPLETYHLPSMITLSINGGRKNKISAGDILGALTSEGGISGNDVGKIDRMDYITFVAVKRKCAAEALEILEKGQVKGRRFKAIIND